MVRKILGGILVYALVVYTIVAFGPGYDFYPIRITPPESIEYIPFFLVLGGIFWLIYDVIRYILKLLTIPLNLLTFGGLHMLINISVLYLVPYLVNQADMGVTVTMGGFIEVVLMAIVISIVGLLIKYV